MDGIPNVPDKALEFIHDVIRCRYGWEDGVAVFCRKFPHFKAQQVHDLFRNRHRKPNVGFATALTEALDLPHIPASWWGFKP